MPSLLIIPVTPEQEGFAALRAASIGENFNMLRRLEANWLSDENRFNDSGEKLLGLVIDGGLAGIGGLNRDPYSEHDRAGRIRHLYVSPVWRGNGNGLRLLQAIVDGADAWFDFLNTHAPETAFRFYERAGFNAVADEERVTHRLIVRR